MTRDDDVWKLYAKGVKKIARKRNTDIPSPLRGGLGRGARRKTEESGLRMAPSPYPSLEGRGILSASPIFNKSQTSLDRRAEKNLRLGEITIEARIDLHGMTQAEAHEALAQFMFRQVKSGKRNLLIITGKGKGNQGTLRTNFPIWLQSLPEASQILTFRTAAPKHGGEGAFYVILKRKK